MKKKIIFITCFLLIFFTVLTYLFKSIKFTISQKNLSINYTLVKNIPTEKNLTYNTFKVITLKNIEKNFFYILKNPKCPNTLTYSNILSFFKVKKLKNISKTSIRLNPKITIFLKKESFEKKFNSMYNVKTIEFNNKNILNSSTPLELLKIPNFKNKTVSKSFNKVNPSKKNIELNRKKFIKSNYEKILKPSYKKIIKPNFKKSQIKSIEKSKTIVNKSKNSIKNQKKKNIYKPVFFNQIHLLKNISILRKNKLIKHKFSVPVKKSPYIIYKYNKNSKKYTFKKIYITPSQQSFLNIIFGNEYKDKINTIPELMDNKLIKKSKNNVTSLSLHNLNVNLRNSILS